MSTLESVNANDLVEEILRDSTHAPSVQDDEASNVVKEGDIRIVNGRNDREVNSLRCSSQSFPSDSKWIIDENTPDKVSRVSLKETNL